MSPCWPLHGAGERHNKLWSTVLMQQEEGKGVVRIINYQKDHLSPEPEAFSQNREVGILPDSYVYVVFSSLNHCTEKLRLLSCVLYKSAWGRWITTTWQNVDLQRTHQGVILVVESIRISSYVYVLMCHRLYRLLFYNPMIPRTESWNSFCFSLISPQTVGTLSNIFFF